MLPSGYQKLTDPSTGRPYYVNLVTGQTSWTPPAGADAPAPRPASGSDGGIVLAFTARVSSRRRAGCTTHVWPAFTPPRLIDA